MVRKQPDRVWVRPRKVHGRDVWQVVSVTGGSRATRIYSSREEAERQRKVIGAAIEAGQLDAPATWQEAIDGFVADRARPGKRRPAGGRPATLDFYRRRLVEVGRVLGGDPDPLTLSIADGESFVLARGLEVNRKGTPISGATIRGEIESTTIMQRWMVKQGWMPTATWSDLTRPEIVSSKRALRPDEVGRFLRAAARLGSDPTLGGERDRRPEDWSRWPAAVWLLMHGLRTAEAEHLRVRDLDLVTGHVHVEDREGARTKNRSSERVIPILAEPALVTLRDTFRGVAGDELAFPVHSRGGSAEVRSQWFLRRVHVTCDLADVPRVSTHELRHTVATAALVAGADMHSVQSLLGHADARMTARVYAHASAAERSMGAARAVSSYLSRVMEAKPSIKAVGS